MIFIILRITIKNFDESSFFKPMFAWNVYILDEME